MEGEKKELHLDPERRHEFVFLFDVRDGNPNGDPDAGNLPRVDPETMHGLVTDVALKRKVRDYVALTRQGQTGFEIFVQSKVALNRLILEGFEKAGIEPVSIPLNEGQMANEGLLEYLDGLTEAGFSRDGETLYYSGQATKATDIAKLLGVEEEAVEPFKEELKTLARNLERAAKERKIGDEDREKAKTELQKRFFDVRMFGAVLSTGLNAGQVRGPIQLTFARSVDPVAPLEVSITRVAITREEDRARKETEMGRKPLVPYGLYRAHGFFNPFLAKKTGVRKEDLEAFWEALVNLFDLDRSAARGEMAVRGLAVFSHEDPKGNAPAHRLFGLIRVERREGVGVPRAFADYRVRAPKEGSLKDHGFPGVYLKWLVLPEGLEDLP
jgi:CRISPR-associated protein Csd2